MFLLVRGYAGLHMLRAKSYDTPRKKIWNRFCLWWSRWFAGFLARCDYSSRAWYCLCLPQDETVYVTDLHGQ